VGNPVSWFEILSRNSTALRDFYASLFGWRIEPYPGEAPYAVVDTGSEGAIRGGLGDPDGPNRVLLYIEVDDPQEVLDQVVEAGGTVVTPVTEIPETVTFAHFADPEGNVLGLSKTALP
jgi:predicted enzyme related to lactoylglutathione lyase